MEIKDYQAGEQERLEWLSQLKIGDQVAIDCSRYGKSNYRLGTVQRVTATQIILPSGDRYRKQDGRLIGGDRWHSPSLIKPDDKIKSWFKRQNLLAAAKKIEFERLTNDQLEAILAVLVTKCD